MQAPKVIIAPGVDNARARAAGFAMLACIPWCLTAIYAHAILLGQALLKPLSPCGGADLHATGLGELLERIVAAVSKGGAVFALVVSIGFIATWALSHARAPRASESATPRVLPYLAFGSSMIPVTLTVVAVVTRFLPGTLPLTLKVFGLSVLAAALSWSLGILAVFVGGNRGDLSRARWAVFLSGTPWYALTLYLASLM